MKEIEFEDIIAKYHLGIEQGEKIITWADNQLTLGKEKDIDFLINLALLDKYNDWEIFKAEEIFFNYYKLDEDEILKKIKIYFFKNAYEYPKRIVQTLPVNRYYISN
ncbi:MAG: hypothetical protein CSA15_02015 [Candidatus Delongbacteria bacterium]|nr:MAG: hypothetical protein CSA15_02015 [Candidatus Delongbacteria bacterium]